MGEALGRRLETLAKPEFAPHSIVASACLSREDSRHRCIVAVGTDTPHTRTPAADGDRLIRAGTHRDFRRCFVRWFVGSIKGGVYLNVGSAVVLPEVFFESGLGGAEPGLSFGGTSPRSISIFCSITGRK